MKKQTHLLLPCAALILTGWLGAANAAEEEQGFGGEAELGVVSTSGNTQTSSVNAKAKLMYRADDWRHEGRLEALRSRDRSETTAERYLASGKSDYYLTKMDYLFGTLRYEEDRFSGYSYQFSEAVGYGRRVINQETLTLDLEIGAGGHHSKESGTNVRKNEAMLRGGVKLGWDISPTARFTEELLIEGTRHNTSTESVTALTASINAHFALRLSLTVKHNSHVPADTKKTDTLSAATLVYNF